MRDRSTDGGAVPAGSVAAAEGDGSALSETTAVLVAAVDDDLGGEEGEIESVCGAAGVFGCFLDVAV